MKLKLGMLLLATVPLMSACDAEVDGLIDASTELIEAITSKLNGSGTQTGASQSATEEKAAGFLYAEGIIPADAQVRSFGASGDNSDTYVFQAVEYNEYNEEIFLWYEVDASTGDIYLIDDDSYYDVTYDDNSSYTEYNDDIQYAYDDESYEDESYDDYTDDSSDTVYTTDEYEDEASYVEEVAASSEQSSTQIVDSYTSEDIVSDETSDMDSIVDEVVYTEEDAWYLVEDVVPEGYSFVLDSEDEFMYRYHVYIEVDGMQETYDYYIVDAYTGEVTAESTL